MVHHRAVAEAQVDVAASVLDTDKPAEPVRALTALRGLAAWWVVAFHFREALPPETPGFLRAAAAHGYLAVDLFFILSGYVIALNYASWFGARATLRSYVRFLLLRLSRIYPLHVVLLALFLINPLAIVLFSSQGSVTGLRWDYFALSIVLAQNWGLTEGTAWNIPAWSISTEWLAYLCFPLIAAFGAVLTASPARGRTAPCAILVLIAGVTAAVSPAGLGYGDQAFELFRCLAEFTLGTLIIQLDGKGRSQRRSTAALALALGCFTVTTLWDLPDSVLIPAGFTLSVYALTDETLAVSRWLHGRALQWLGLVSYSTYLSHYLIKTWVKFTLVRPAVPGDLVFPIYLLSVLAASAVLYARVEHPAQRWCRQRLRAAQLI